MHGADFIYFITEWIERTHDDAQWFSLRRWICMHVVRHSDGRHRSTHSHQLLLNGSSVQDGCSTVARANAASGAVASDAHLFGGVGRVPALSVRKEVMHALAEVGFSHAVQSTAIMDFTLSDVLQVLRSTCFPTPTLLLRISKLMLVRTPHASRRNVH
jgi:hypothetical protein